MAMGRSFQSARRKYNGEIKADRPPINFSQRSDLGLNFPTQYVERQIITEPDTKASGEIGIYRY